MHSVRRDFFLWTIETRDMSDFSSDFSSMSGGSSDLGSVSGGARRKRRAGVRKSSSKLSSWQKFVKKMMPIEAKKRSSTTTPMERVAAAWRKKTGKPKARKSRTTTRSRR